MVLFLRVLRIPWTQKLTNIEVLRYIQKTKEFTISIIERKTRYIGRLMRGKQFEDDKIHD